MRETHEIRLPEGRASIFFHYSEGHVAGSGPGAERVVAIEASDPRFARIGALDAESRALGKGGLITGYRVRREFTDAERSAASLFRLEIRRVFGPSGAECGTEHDATAACPRCGVGRIRTSPRLRLDCASVRGAAIARTVANEIVVSRAVAERLEAGGFTGFELRPIERPREPWPGPFRLESVPSGRLLAERARARGIEPRAFEFAEFASGGEERDLLARARAEAAPRTAEPEIDPEFLELVPTGPRAEIVPPTRCGVSPFDPDEAGAFRCPEGHTLGLRLLTPVTVACDAAAPGADLVATRQAVGWPTALATAPAPLLLLSPRLESALRPMAARSLQTEPAENGARHDFHSA